MNANRIPNINSPDFGIIGTNGPGFALGLLLIGDAPIVAGADQLSLGLALHIDLFASTELLAFDFINRGGNAAFAPVPIPNNPVLPGSNYYAQGIWIENAGLGEDCGAAPAGLVSSRGLLINIQP